MDIASARDSVRDYYDSYGWVVREDGYSGEDDQFRSYPQTRAWREFSKRRDRRVAALLADRSGALLIVGGGDLPDAHRPIAEAYEDVAFVDLSSAALDHCRRKFGDRARYIQGSITQAPVEGRFNAALAAHVIYHIHADEQEAAVRRMIAAAAPGARIVIVYANPNSPSALPGRIARWLKGKVHTPPNAPMPLYFHAHPLRWWRRFGDAGEVAILPWAPLNRRSSTALVRNETIARIFFAIARTVEDRQPWLAARLWHYPIVVLTVR